jgi:outer membrane protein TolC
MVIIKLRRYLKWILIFFFLGSLAAAAQDKTLDSFLNKSISSSPLLNDYSNQILANRIDSMRLRASYLPQLTGSSAGLYAPIIKGYGYDGALTNGQALEALLTINYSLTKKNILDNQLQSFRLRSDSVRFAAKLSEQDLKKTITEQYITAFASQQQVRFNREITDLLKQEEIILKKLTQANAYKQVDYLAFLVTLQQQILQLKQAEIQFKNDYTTLNYLSGIADTSLIRLQEPGIAVISLPRQGNSIFLNQFLSDSLRMINERKAIDFSYRPKAGVYANGGYNSSFILQPYKNFGTSVGFTISVPIYDGHQKKMQYDQLNIRESTRLRYRDFFVTQQQQQIALLRQQISEKSGLKNQIDEQIRFSKSLIDADIKLLQTGNVTVTDFIIAINNYLAAQNLFRQINIDILKLINQLNYWNK